MRGTGGLPGAICRAVQRGAGGAARDLPNRGVGRGVEEWRPGHWIVRNRTDDVRPVPVRDGISVHAAVLVEHLGWRRCRPEVRQLLRPLTDVRYKSVLGLAKYL